jgi:hypothetical protein
MTLLAYICRNAGKRVRACPDSKLRHRSTSSRITATSHSDEDSDASIRAERRQREVVDLSRRLKHVHPRRSDSSSNNKWFRKPVQLFRRNSWSRVRRRKRANSTFVDADEVHCVDNDTSGDEELQKPNSMWTAWSSCMRTRRQSRREGAMKDLEKGLPSGGESDDEARRLMRRQSSTTEGRRGGRVNSIKFASGEEPGELAEPLEPLDDKEVIERRIEERKGSCAQERDRLMGAEADATSMVDADRRSISQTSLPVKVSDRNIVVRKLRGEGTRWDMEGLGGTDGSSSFQEPAEQTTKSRSAATCASCIVACWMIHALCCTQMATYRRHTRAGGFQYGDKRRFVLDGQNDN